MNFTFGPMKFNVAGRAWNNWHNSGGESGIEPPPEAKRLYELRDLLYSTGDADERREVLTEMWENQAENLWVIGVGGRGAGPVHLRRQPGQHRGRRGARLLLGGGGRRRRAVVLEELIG